LKYKYSQKKCSESSDLIEALEKVKNEYKTNMTFNYKSTSGKITSKSADIRDQTDKNYASIIGYVDTNHNDLIEAMEKSRSIIEKYYGIETEIVSKESGGNTEGKSASDFVCNPDEEKGSEITTEVKIPFAKVCEGLQIKTNSNKTSIARGSIKYNRNKPCL
jgi:hypothetical protein